MSASIPPGAGTVAAAAAGQQINVSGTDPSPYLKPFNLYGPPGESPQQCDSNITDNRFNINFTFTDTGKQETFYCWQGVVATEPNCVIGSVCSQYSFTEARTAFCDAFGAEPGGCGSNALANVYVPNINPNQPVTNERGGIIAANAPGACSGQAIIGQLQCMVNSVRQSAANVLDPHNYKNLIYTGATLTVFIIIMVIIIHYKLIKLKKGTFKGMKPKKMNLRPINKPRNVNI